MRRPVSIPALSAVVTALLPVALLPVALLPVALPAQEVAGQVKEASAGLGKTELAAVASWKEYQASVAAYRSENAPIAEELRPVYRDYVAAKKDGDDITGLQKQLDDLRARSAAVHKKHRPAMDRALDSFHTLFLRSNWGAYDAGSHGDLLESGLMHAGQQAMEEDPEQAVKAFEMFLARCPKARSRRYVDSMYLPTALVAAGRADKARAHVQALLEAKPEPALYVTLGDLAAIQGRLEEAARHWEQAGKDDRYAQLRLKLVNKPAPDIAARQWIGGEAQALSALRGRVCVLDFWATWCGPCRAVMPALSKFHEAYADKGLKVIGVTRFHAKGYLPRNKSEMRSGGESVQGMSEATYPAHLTAFQKNTGIAYPFAVASQEDFDAYGITGIPTVVVVDRKGKVVFVGVGGACEPLVRAAAIRVLGAAR